jgi:acyl carrier protein
MNLRTPIGSTSILGSVREKLQIAVGAGKISENEVAGPVLENLLDSLDMVELIMAIEEIKGSDDLPALGTVRDLILRLERLENDNSRHSR